ncbi:hypothetical protein pb186bvf_014017 [Paramecium bursaria]
MYKIILIFVLSILAFGSFINPQIDTFDCEQLQFKRPDVFYVRGTASINAQPTIARIRLGIDIKDQSASEVLTKSQQITESSQKSLLGFQQSGTTIKITTTQFSLQPHVEYDWNGNQQTIKFQGYRINNELEVSTENLQIVGSLIDAAVKAGVTSVVNVDFDIRDNERAQYKDKLLELAVADAQHKAKVALDKLNMKIVSVKSVSLDSYIQPQQPVYMKSMAMNDMAGSAPTEIFAQEKALQYWIHHLMIQICLQINLKLVFQIFIEISINSEQLELYIHSQ